MSDYCNIIFLAPFPLFKKDSGGLIRSSYLRDYLKVKTKNFIELSVFDSKIWGDHHNENYFVMPLDAKERLSFQGMSIYCADLDITDWCCKQNNIIEFIRKKIKPGNLLIWMEYPWLWKLAATIKKEVQNYHDCNIFYSSANIENEVYKEILEKNNNSNYEELPNIIKNIELNAIANADCCIACSDYDEKKLKTMGAKTSKVLPNGISNTSFDVSSIYKNALYEKLASFDYYFYAASDWPPNVSCIKEIIGSNLGFIPPGKKLVVAGGASRVFKELYLNKEDSFYLINKERILILGQLNNEAYACAHTLAKGYFLPVSYGGGTCLKTAEALYTGKHVLATQAAARGYDDFRGLPNFEIVSDDMFSEKLASTFQNKFKKYIFSRSDVVNLENLTWQTSLEKLKI